MQLQVTCVPADGTRHPGKKDIKTGRAAGAQ